MMRICPMDIIELSKEMTVRNSVNAAIMYVLYVIAAGKSTNKDVKA